MSSPLASLLIAPYVAGKVVELQQICATGDPGDPGLTQQDAADLADYFNITANARAVERVTQWVVHMMWPTWCNCNDGTAPPANTAGPAPPVGVNTGLPAGPLGNTCWDANATLQLNATHVWSFNDYFPRGGALPGWPTGSGPPPQRLPTPAPTEVFFSGTRHSATPATTTYSSQIQFRDAAGVLIAGTGYTQGSTPAEQTFSIGGATPANVAYIQAFINDITQNNPNDTATGRIQLFCGTDTPITPVVPCCPPDPNLDIRLREIEQLERVIIQLLGRGETSHIDGTRHAGLTNSGSIVLVDSVTAIRVEVTSSLQGWPSNPGVPTYFFSLGFITSIALESPLKGWRLVYGSQTFPIVSYADSIGYTLPPGVSIDIIELLPAA